MALALLLFLFYVLRYVRLRYTDGQGALKPLTRGLIHVSVKGGTLLGLGNGCPYNDTGYLTSSTDTYYGEALAIVRPDGSGPVQVAAESPLPNSRFLSSAWKTGNGLNFIRTI